MTQRNRVMRLACLAGLLAGGLRGADCPGDGRGLMPIAEVRSKTKDLESWKTVVHVCGQVTVKPGDLPDDRGNFYIQDSTGGISVVAIEPPAFKYGEWIRVSGRMQVLSTREAELQADTWAVAGPGRMPPPRRIKLEELASGKFDGWHVSVGGTVSKTSVGGTREDLTLTHMGQSAEAYTRVGRGQPSLIQSLAPIGAVVDVTGVAMPTESAQFSRLRFRGSQDVRVLETPPYFSTRSGRIHGMAALSGALLAVGWILTLKRSVRRQTAEIRALLFKAEEASRLKSEFLANISHEIRTPLHGIIGLQKLALDEVADPRPRHYMELANQASTHLLALMNGVLDMAAIDRGAIEVSHEAMAPAELLREASEMFVALASSKGLRLESIDLGLPRLVLGDPVRVKQVLVNLVNNAVKFTPAGSVLISGRALREKESWRLHFEVADTGIGIAEEQQGQIFDAFRQADGSIRRQYGGTGLGLALSARLVGMMGGSIDVKSRPGEGSIFRFSVLCGVCDEPDAPAESGAEACVASSLRLLLVEDNRLNQMVATSLLLKDGHRVEVAENGLQALAAFSRSSFDAVLMDVQMPKMDGLTATREIRALEGDGPHVPILALTAHTNGEDHEALCKAGVDGVLSKPFSPEQLRSALAKVAPRSRPEPERAPDTVQRLS